MSKWMFSKFFLFLTFIIFLNQNFYSYASSKKAAKKSSKTQTSKMVIKTSEKTNKPASKTSNSSQKCKRNLFTKYKETDIQISSVKSDTPLEGRLHKVYFIWSQKKYKELVDELRFAPQTTSLEPFRLYLLAEAEKNTLLEANAIENYKKVFTLYPHSYFAQMALYNYLVLKLKLFSLESEKEILNMLSKVNSSLLRSRIYEKIADLYSAVDSKQKLIYLLKAFDDYSSFKQSFEPYSEIKDLIYKIVTDPLFLIVANDETIIRIAFQADKLSLLRDFERSVQLASNVFNKDFIHVKLLLNALMVQNQHSNPQIINHIDSFLANPILKSPKYKSYVYALRFIKANIYIKNRHLIPAIAEYKLAFAYAETPKQKIECLYRVYVNAAEAEYHTEALEALKNLLGYLQFEFEIKNLPNKIFEFGLKCYDMKNFSHAMRYFEFLYQNFPEHYRADDAIGYTIKCLSHCSDDASTINRLGSLLSKNYFYSFFYYWLFPNSRNSLFTYKNISKLQLTPQQKDKLIFWKILLKSPFNDLAQKDIFFQLDNYPSIENFYIAGTACEYAKDYFTLTAVGKRLLEWFYKNNYKIADLPLWGWYFLYPKPYWNKIQLEANKYNLDPYWVLSIMREESHFNPKILSRSNAHGLMQILPSTGKWIAEKLGIKFRKFEKEKLFDTNLNIEMGTWYLRYLLDFFGGNFYLATAAYNAGQGNIKRYLERVGISLETIKNSSINYNEINNDRYLEILDKINLPETRDYYKKVLGSYWSYKRLYASK